MLQVSTADLLSLQRVSHHFFSLATAEIYRDLDFNFTSSDALHNGTPHSRTADAVQTVVASDRNYGLHIRSFRLGISEETSNNALLMSRVLWDSAADPSKVLNTVILLMVRQAGMMESFQWVHISEAINSAQPLTEFFVQVGHTYRAEWSCLSSPPQNLDFAPFTDQA